MTTQEFKTALEAVEARHPGHVANIRNLPRKERSKHIRRLFKTLGLRGFSVTTPNYSMACHTEIDMPDVEWAEYDPETLNPVLNAYSECIRRVEAIVVKAFPDLVDRSDTMTDYFDYAFTVR